MLSFTTIAKTSQDVTFLAYNLSCNRKWLMDYTDGEGDRIILKECGEGFVQKYWVPQISGS